MSASDVADDLNGKRSWHSRRQLLLKSMGLWDHYGQIPRFEDRNAHHRKWLPGGGRRE